MRKAGIYLAIFSNSAKIYIFYWHEILAQFVQRSINISLTIAFWYIISNASSGGIDINRLVGYLGLAIIITFITLGHYFGMADRIEQLILNGGLTSYLLQPIDSLNNIAASAEGAELPQRLSGLTFVILAIIIIKPSVLSLVWFLVFLMLAIVIGRAINIFVGAQVFWTHDRRNIRHSIYQVMLIFAGIYLPIDFLPFSAIVKNILKYSPFGYSVYWPVKVLQGHSVTLSLISGAVLWAIFLLIFARLFWKIGLRKYGGYGL